MALVRRGIVNAVWYDKQSSDPGRPWLVRLHGGGVVRARAVRFAGACSTGFQPEGFSNLQPGGPRGVIFAERVELENEGPVAP